MIADLTDATFVDSTTLGVLIGIVRRLRANDGQLAVVCSDRNVAKTFELTDTASGRSAHLPVRQGTIGPAGLDITHLQP